MSFEFFHSRVSFERSKKVCYKLYAEKVDVKLPCALAWLTLCEMGDLAEWKFWMTAGLMMETGGDVGAGDPAGAGLVVESGQLGDR